MSPLNTGAARGLLLYNSSLVVGAASANADPSFSSVSLLLHMDGSNGSTTITDSSSSPQTVTARLGSSLSTAQYKFGTASASFSGANNFSVPSGSWSDLTGNATIEMWFRPTSIGSAYQALITKDTAGSTFSWGILVKNNAIQVLTNQTTQNVTATATIANNTWYHVAATNTPSQGIAIFLDGQKISATNSVQLTNSTTSAVSIGAAGPTAGTNSFFTGFIDEVRITKAIRYAANFTPPTAAFPDF